MNLIGRSADQGLAQMILERSLRGVVLPGSPRRGAGPRFLGSRQQPHNVLRQAGSPGSCALHPFRWRSLACQRHRHPDAPLAPDRADSRLPGGGLQRLQTLSRLPGVGLQRLHRVSPLPEPGLLQRLAELGRPPTRFLLPQSPRSATHRSRPMKALPPNTRIPSPPRVDRFPR